MPRSAGPAFDPGRREDRSRLLSALTGADGHHAPPTRAGIDPDFGRDRVLPAARIDGAPLHAHGPLRRARRIGAITAVGGGRGAAAAR